MSTSVDTGSEPSRTTRLEPLAWRQRFFFAPSVVEGEFAPWRNDVMVGPMAVTFGVATDADAAAIAALRMAAARDLTERFGMGTWSFAAETETSVRAELRNSTLLLARDEGVLIGTLRLSTRNPWLGNTSFFTATDRPIFLTSMAIAPKWQRRGIGRQLLEEARTAAAKMGGEALRLDSYAEGAGAGDFYRKCGFREVRRGDYNGTPLIWFETSLPRRGMSDKH